MGCLRLAPTEEKSTVLRCIWRCGNSTKSGVDRYDYGFRFYDPQIARFTGIDPASEQFVWVTPYNYAENNPISNIDLWGLQAFCIHGLQSSSADWQKEGFQRVKETLVFLTIKLLILVLIGVEMLMRLM